MIFLADRAAVDDAALLIAKHGGAAAFEAASRANRSRAVGNVAHFCRWRQIERLIDLLATDYACGTVH
ncbi:hypothetical protein F1C10_08155 [Sphingomonas sp. NBWT7]|uniref:hypothetical protein n=1 Tax=Sphingomonas sp. NBWT7 TaxID=2596913 RepID=UPI001623FF6E|nr:hypothetical protein [Sphingomonas sp. NBWT7]QNE33406.1 hypothetical protein F1C10_08155 [Sphingomonas sp. NBWT7]